MSGGYAVVAWPAKYGDTGVMTFIAGSDGKVYQRNLGPQTASALPASRHSIRAQVGKPHRIPRFSAQ